MHSNTSSNNPIFTNPQLILELRRMLWATMIKIEMRCFSIYKLEKIFAKPEQFVSTPEGTNHPTSWYKYLKGQQSPSKRTLKKITKKVNRATYWFNLPMWEILQKPVSKERLDFFLRDARPDIANKLFTIKGNYSAELVRKKIRNHENLIKFLCIDSSIDALNTIIILCAEIEMSKNISLGRVYFWALLEILMNFCRPHPYYQFFAILYKTIKERFHYAWVLDEKIKYNVMDISLKGAHELLDFTNSLTMYCEDLCVLMLSETSKANSLCYQFFRCPSETRTSIIKFFNNKNNLLNKVISPEIKMLIWDAIRIKV